MRNRRSPAEKEVKISVVVKAGTKKWLTQDAKNNGRNIYRHGGKVLEDYRLSMEAPHA